MLINSNDIKTAKEHIDVMQAFINGKEIEFKQDSYKGIWKQTTAPIWDFTNYKYRIKHSEPEYVYPIYKRLKVTPEIIVKFTSIDSGIYIGTGAQSIYKPGDAVTHLRPHTSCSWEDYELIEEWEDYEFIEEEEREVSTIISKPNTIELFEVMIYCDITEEYSIKKSLYSNEDLEELQHYQKSGRSFIIGKDTRQIIKVINT